VIKVKVKKIQQKLKRTRRNKTSKKNRKKVLIILNLLKKKREILNLTSPVNVENLLRK